MRKMRRKTALAVVVAAISCSGGGGTTSSAPQPRSEGAVGFGAAGRMTGGTLTADVRIGAPLGSQEAQGGKLTMTEPVLTR